MKWLATNLLYLNMAWYCALTLAFMIDGDIPKTLYFLGAGILTIGVVLM